MRVDYSKWNLDLVLGFGEGKTENASKSKKSGQVNGRAERFSKFNCFECQKLISVDELLTCARCKLIDYCSKECQRLHWKAGHKTECVPAGVFDTSTRLEKAVECLKMVLDGHSNKPMFRSHSCCVDATMVDLASAAREVQEKYGLGYTMMQFGSVDEAEDLIASLCLVLQGSLPEDQYPVLPTLKYRLWSAERGDLESNGDIYATAVNVMMKQVLPDNTHFGFGIRIVASGGTFFSVFTGLPHVGSGPGIDEEQFRACFPHAKSNFYPAPFESARVAFSAARLLDITPVGNIYMYMHQGIMAMLTKNRPGILWLRNMRSGKDAYKRSDLKRLKNQLVSTVLEEAMDAQRDCDDDKQAAVFLPFDLEQKKFHHPIIHEHWPSLAEHRLEEILDKKVILGFFLTTLHGHTNKCIVSEFTVPLPSDLQIRMSDSWPGN